MNFYVMTLFPEMIEQGLNTSIIGRAMEKELLSVEKGTFFSLLKSEPKLPRLF